MNDNFDSLNDFGGQSDDNDWANDLFSDDNSNWGGNSGFDQQNEQSSQGINVDNEDFSGAVNSSGSDQGASDYIAPGREDLNNPADHKNSIKVAAMIIALGVIIIIAALIVYRFIQKPKTNTGSTQQNVLVQQAQSEQTGNNIQNNGSNVQVQPQTSTDTSVSEQPVQSNQVNNSLGTQGNTYTTPGQTDIGQSEQVQDDGWVKFQSNQDAVIYQQDYVAATFTVTKVANYVNVSDADTDYIQIKQTLSGQIQGLPGTFQIDVPYNLGSNVQVGQSFDVQVLYGTYNGRTVVGDVRYY